MSSAPGPLPPFPTNDGGAGSVDQTFNENRTFEQSLDDLLNWLKKNSTDIGTTTGAVHAASQIGEKAIATFGKAIEWIIVHLAEAEMVVDDAWVKAEAAAYLHAAAPLEEAAATEANIAMGILLEAMSGGAGGDHNFGGSSMSGVAQQAFNELVQPFTLINSGLDPSVVGSGVQAQQHLLAKSIGMALQEWIVDQLGNHLGMGFFKTLSPFLGVIDRSVNPSNVVRQAMESSYAFLLKAPLTRDLNRQYPIKNIGVNALAKLYIRGAIDLSTYLDKCLDFGLDNTQAQQLILESAKAIDRGDVTKLLKLKLITDVDARKLLQQQGYQDATIDAVIHLDTHDRYFTIAERVGYAAVTAYKKRYITKDRLEQLLEQLGFTTDETMLLEIEAEFVKSTGGEKDLTATQVKDMFAAGIIGIDDVTAYLQAQGYSAENVMRLVLLDFTKAEERTLMRDRLVAQLRVSAAQDAMTAAADQAKNEAALAAAKDALAAELDREAAAYGQLATQPGILGLIG